MLSEEEVSAHLRAAFQNYDEPEIQGAMDDTLKASENAGFEITLVDGTRFQVVVTMVEEGQ